MCSLLVTHHSEVKQSGRLSTSPDSQWCNYWVSECAKITSREITDVSCLTPNQELSTICLTLYATSREVALILIDPIYSMLATCDD